MKISAIIDNTVLANFIRIEKLDFLNLLKNLFSEILIPETIKNEFAYKSELTDTVKRIRFVENLSVDYGFYKLCNSFDRVVFEFMKSEEYIDEGEAEAVAQAERRQVYIFLTDDTKCIEILEKLKPHIRILDSLTLICTLDIRGYLPLDFSSCLAELYTHYKFDSEKIRQSYQKASRFLGLTIDKKKMNKKISMKNILSIYTHSQNKSV